MTDNEKLQMTRTMVGISADDANWSDTILTTYLTIAKDKILHKAFPFSNDIELPSKYDVLQCEIAVYLLNRRGSEGETSHSENGINRSYESADVPDSMLKSVTPFVGVM